MELKHITLKKFIGLNDILTADFYPTEVDREVALLVTLTGKKEDYFLNMRMDEFKKYSSVLSVLKIGDVQPDAKRFINANGNVYAPVYEFAKLTAGQFIDVTFFLKETENMIENLPKILASLCVPTKKTLTGRKLLVYGATDHKKVTKDMEEASIVDAYSIAVFFWDAWKAFLISTGDCLIKELIAKKEQTKTKFSQRETADLVNILQLYGDGITARKGLL